MSQIENHKNQFKIVLFSHHQIRVIFSRIFLFSNYVKLLMFKFLNYSKIML